MILGYCTCLLLFSSCEKPEGDHLTGDYEVLVGTWSWYESLGSGSTDVPGYYDSTPESLGDTYRVKFEKVGRFKTWKNGEELHEGTITHFSDGSIIFKDGSYQLSGTFREYNQDTIHLSSYPFDEINIRSFFRRVE